MDILKLSINVIIQTNALRYIHYQHNYKGLVPQINIYVSDVHLFSISPDFFRRAYKNICRREQVIVHNVTRGDISFAAAALSWPEYTIQVPVDGTYTATMVRGRIFEDWSMNFEGSSKSDMTLCLDLDGDTTVPSETDIVSMYGVFKDTGLLLYDEEHLHTTYQKRKLCLHMR